MTDNEAIELFQQHTQADTHPLGLALERKVLSMLLELRSLRMEPYSQRIEQCEQRVARLETEVLCIRRRESKKR
jgi:hypothetical protein